MKKNMMEHNKSQQLRRKDAVIWEILFFNEGKRCDDSIICSYGDKKFQFS